MASRVEYLRELLRGNGSAMVRNIVALFRAEKSARKWRKRNRGHSKCATNNSQRYHVVSCGNSAVFTPLLWLNEGKRDHACWEMSAKFWNWCLRCIRRETIRDPFFLRQGTRKPFERCLAIDRASGTWLVMVK